MINQATHKNQFIQCFSSLHPELWDSIGTQTYRCLFYSTYIPRISPLARGEFKATRVPSYDAARDHPWLFTAPHFSGELIRKSA